MAGHSPLPPAGPSTRHLGSTKSPSCGSEAQVTARAVPWEGDRGIIVSHGGFWNAKQKLGVRSGETNMKSHRDKAAGPSGPQHPVPGQRLPCRPRKARIHHARRIKRKLVIWPEPRVTRGPGDTPGGNLK